jgi:hypothetical protein
VSAPRPRTAASSRGRSARRRRRRCARGGGCPGRAPRCPPTPARGGAPSGACTIRGSRRNSWAGGGPRGKVPAAGAGACARLRAGSSGGRFYAIGRRGGNLHPAQVRPKCFHGGPGPWYPAGPRETRRRHAGIARFRRHALRAVLVSGPSRTGFGFGSGLASGLAPCSASCGCSGGARDHERVVGRGRWRDGSGCSSRRGADRRRELAATRRHHHGRQRPVGAAKGPAARGRARARGGARCGGSSGPRARSASRR